MRFLALPILLLASCATPLVGYGQFAGVGDVRTDGQYLVAFGDITGEAGVFAKGSNLPVTIPFTVSSSQVFLYDGEKRWLQPVEEPLPAWCRDLIPPSHEASLEDLLLIDLTFSGGE